jgi:hypothetical protein
VSIDKCTNCRALLSPWEGYECLTCQGVWPWTNADMAVMVLEREAHAVGVYDIERGIKREFSTRVSRPSLQVVLSGDRRFCWAGKGRYGLLRHELFPGPRNLAGVAKFLLYAHDASLTTGMLAFVMKVLGYRFQDVSLSVALDKGAGAGLKRDGWSSWIYERSPSHRRALAQAGLGSQSDVDEVAETYSKRVANAIRERSRRLSR